MIKKLIVICIFTLFLSSCGKKEYVKLSLSMNKGGSYTQKMVLDQKIVQDIEGKKQVIEQTLGMGFTFEILDVDTEGNASVKTTYTWLKFSMKNPGISFEYDSADPPKEIHPGAKGLAALLNESFTMKMSPKGAVSEIEGIESLMNKIIDSLELPPGPMKQTMEKQLKDQFGEKSIAENMEQMMALYPEDKIAIGDSWKKKIITSGGMPMILDNTWTLKKKKDGILTVKVKSGLMNDPAAEPMKMGTMSIHYSFEGSQDGTTLIDEATGWIISAKLEQEFSGTMTMGGVPGAKGELEIPMTVKGTVTLSR